MTRKTAICGTKMANVNLTHTNNNINLVSSNNKFTVVLFPFRLLDFYNNTGSNQGYQQMELDEVGSNDFVKIINEIVAGGVTVKLYAQISGTLRSQAMLTLLTTNNDWYYGAILIRSDGSSSSDGIFYLVKEDGTRYSKTSVSWASAFNPGVFQLDFDTINNTTQTWLAGIEWDDVLVFKNFLDSGAFGTTIDQMISALVRHVGNNFADPDYELRLKELM